MMTPDKDYTQLVNDNVSIYKPSRAGSGVEILGVKEVQEKFSVERPEQVIDILALWGDSSDNVPGAPGIGEKTSKRLIGRFGSVENLLKNVNMLSGKQRENLINFKDQILLSKELVTIKTDIPLEATLNTLEVREHNKEKLSELYIELEFRNLLNRLNNNFTEQKQSKQIDLFNSVKPESNTPQRDINYSFADTPFLRKNIIEKLQKCKKLSLFPVTKTNENNKIGKFSVLGFAFGVSNGESVYIAFPENENDVIKVLNELKPIFENTEINIIAHQLKNIVLFLKQHNINLKTKIFDTEVAHYLLEPEQKHDINLLREKYLDVKFGNIIQHEDLFGKKGKNDALNISVSLEKISHYACAQADVVFHLEETFLSLLQEKKTLDLFNLIEMPLIHSLVTMENNGVCVDKEILHDISEKLNKEILEIEHDIYKLANKEFNISSPKQLGIILFEDLNISEKPPRTKTKQYATGEDILVKYREKHPIINQILEYRSIKKLLSTYVDVLPNLVDPQTQRIHSTFKQTVTATGRLSSTNPNLQNIPIREERGKMIRKAFIPSDKEHVFFSADYSQIELRIMAHLSKDPNMLAAFRDNNEDIHRATAAKIFKITPEEVSDTMRSQAKTANFGIIYGISAFGLAQRLDIPRKDAKLLIENYFETFPDVKTFIEKSIETARANEYVETILGRRRNLPDINSKNAMVRSFAERNAVNAPIQGSAADIIKIAMIGIQQAFDENNLQSEMILQVHDELNFNVLKSEKDIVKDIVVHEMENAISLRVPLIATHSFGNNWLEAH